MVVCLGGLFMDVDVVGVKAIVDLLSGMEEHRHFIQDDFQRFGFDNFESGIRFACEKLGVCVD